MPDHFRYRIGSGEVLGASSDVLQPPAPNAFEAWITDPTLPDGRDVGPANRKIRVGGTVRNATAPEIAGFAAADAADRLAEAKLSATAMLDNPQTTARLLRAIALVILDEINALRAAHTTAHPGAPLAARTAAQVKTSIRNKAASSEAD